MSIKRIEILFDLHRRDKLKDIARKCYLKDSKRISFKKDEIDIIQSIASKILFEIETENKYDIEH